MIQSLVQSWVACRDGSFTEKECRAACCRDPDAGAANRRHSAAPDGEVRELRAPLRKSIHALGLRLDVLARLGADDDLVLLRGAIHPGRFVPLHSHADPECLFVIGGAIEV